MSIQPMVVVSCGTGNRHPASVFHGLQGIQKDVQKALGQPIRIHFCFFGISGKLELDFDVFCRCFLFNEPGRMFQEFIYIAGFRFNLVGLANSISSLITRFNRSTSSIMTPAISLSLLPFSNLLL
jgi:hypothetical protein